MIKFDLESFCRPGDAFVELGTGRCGGLVKALTCGFSRLHSIEAAPELCAAAMLKFTGEIASGKLSLYCGTTLEWIPYICEQLDGKRAVWWVDAHVDHPAATRSTSPCSVVAEITMLAEYARHRDTVLVDDRRLFGGKGWGAGVTEVAVMDALNLVHPGGSTRLLDNVYPDDVIASEGEMTNYTDFHVTNGMST